MLSHIIYSDIAQLQYVNCSKLLLLDEGGLSGCDSVPLELLRIVSEWMKHRPGLLFTLEGQSDNKEKGLPLRRRSVKSKPFQTFQGLVLWSVLLPLIPVSSRGREETVAPPVDTESTLIQPDKGKLSTDSMTMQYQFHTHLLEALLALPLAPTSLGGLILKSLSPLVRYFVMCWLVTVDQWRQKRVSTDLLRSFKCVVQVAYWREYKKVTQR